MSLQPLWSPPRTPTSPGAPERCRQPGCGAGGGGAGLQRGTSHPKHKHGSLVISNRFKRNDEPPVTGGRVSIKSCHV